ncbi:2712_t:CDS:2 [Entrophospora sp. SA101]|nr:2712_t:CDS:2 [Entrophospora sp. SA101]
MNSSSIDIWGAISENTGDEVLDNEQRLKRIRSSIKLRDLKIMRMMKMDGIYKVLTEFNPKDVIFGLVSIFQEH